MACSVLIVDDHKLIRQAWSLFINTSARFSVIAECGSGNEAIAFAMLHRPDMILMDINLPDMNGMEATQQICKQVPGARIIGVSNHTDPACTRKMMQNGAVGFVTKNSPLHELFLAMTEVLKGKKYICNDIKEVIVEQVFDGNKPINKSNTISKREWEIIDLVKQGHSSREIAGLLTLSLKTIKVHRYNILRKLDLKNSSALVNHTFYM